MPKAIEADQRLKDNARMSTIQISGTSLGSSLLEIMGADDLQPGNSPSYQVCKQIWACHPMGGKLVEKPVALALGQKRKINVPCALEERLVKAHEEVWERLQCTRYISDLAHVSRAYGVGALAYGFPGFPTDEAIDPFRLSKMSGLYFNVLDPLNTAGSMVTNQDPNAPDFQKAFKAITAAGQPYDHSRTTTLFNGTAIYLDYQSSAFSFSGRSIFLRALYPLKSFLQSMQVDDMVSLKAGLLIAKVQQNGSTVDALMEYATGKKRDFVKEGRTGQVLSIGPDESIESIDLQNIDGAMSVARDNIIANIASASDVPAILLKDESFAKGLASGEQDMVAVVQYIDGIREQLAPAHAYMDRICRYIAWNEEFFQALQNEFPGELGGQSYHAWFYRMCDLFSAEWPSLIKTSDTEVVDRNAKKLKAMSDLFKVLAPGLDPMNGAKLRTWIADAVNDMPEVFTNMLVFDPVAFEEYEPPQPVGMPGDEEGGEGDGD